MADMSTTGPVELFLSILILYLISEIHAIEGGAKKHNIEKARRYKSYWENAGS